MREPLGRDVAAAFDLLPKPPEDLLERLRPGCRAQEEAAGIRQGGIELLHDWEARAERWQPLGVQPEVREALTVVRQVLEWAEGWAKLARIA